MNDIALLADRGSPANSATPARQLLDLVRSQLEHAIDGARRGLRVYESLRNLSEVVGTQYGDRVLYELIQNAHDAHSPGDLGEISIHLAVRSEDEGELYVANKGRGFSFRDVEAIRNLATSHKEIGESIGNKGLGFRSVEALTTDVRIYSHMEAGSGPRFSGFCFRFAAVPEIQELLADMDVEHELRDRVAEAMPRYLVSVPLLDQPSEVTRFAEEGFATVVVLPLRTRQAVDLASRQVQALADDEAPLLLFLDRIKAVRIRIERAGEKPQIRALKREPEYISNVDLLPGCSLWRIDVGEGRQFLLVRRRLEKERVLKAVEASTDAAPPLKRWRDWKGDAVVSVAVAWDSPAAAPGRYYNFLPMGMGSIAPLAGYLDAPFYTDIDRRSAKLDLPLNDMLLSASAEVCAAAVLVIAKQKLPIPVPSRAVLDLIAWDAGAWSKLDRGFRTNGTSLRQACVFPALPESRGDPRWVNLAGLVRWPEGRYNAFGPREIVACTTAAVVPANIGSAREERLEKLARSILYRELAPRPEPLAGWAEAVAKSLAGGSARPRAWAEFYDDLRRVFVAIGADLKSLQGRPLLLDRNGILRPSPTSLKNRHVFIRPREDQGRRRRAGPPFPPFSLSRKFYFFDERIPLSSETSLAFEKAGLLRRYDPVSALAGVDAALARGANDNQRRDALGWAFKVWSAGAPGLEKAFATSNLHVPTRGGWLLGRTAAFSSSWTSLGRTLGGDAV